MHSHYGLEIQQLLSAPLIIKDPENNSSKNEKEVVMFLTDFSFESPKSILEKLETNYFSKNSLKNGLVYDAFLTNYRTLSDPEIISVLEGETVRLRIINAASATNFFIDLGTLSGTLMLLREIQLYLFKEVVSK